MITKVNIRRAKRPCGWLHRRSVCVYVCNRFGVALYGIKRMDFHGFASSERSHKPHTWSAVICRNQVRHGVQIIVSRWEADLHNVNDALVFVRNLDIFKVDYCLKRKLETKSWKRRYTQMTTPAWMMTDRRMRYTYSLCDFPWWLERNINETHDHNMRALRRVFSSFIQSRRVIISLKKLTFYSTQVNKIGKYLHW